MLSDAAIIRALSKLLPKVKECLFLVDETTMAMVLVYIVELKRKSRAHRHPPTTLENVGAVHFIVGALPFFSRPLRALFRNEKNEKNSRRYVCIDKHFLVWAILV